jgi:hypothetical protein
MVKNALDNTDPMKKLKAVTQKYLDAFQKIRKEAGALDIKYREPEKPKENDHNN